MAKSLWIGFGIIAVVLIAAVSLVINGINKPGSQPVPPASNNPPAVISGANNIEIKGFAFSPSTLTIRKGETVTWTNLDSFSHTVTSDAGDELNSGTLSKGQSYSHVFDNIGTFSYHCIIHPSMKANVIVE